MNPEKCYSQVLHSHMPVAISQHRTAANVAADEVAPMVSFDVEINGIKCNPELHAFNLAWFNFNQMQI